MATVAEVLKQAGFSDEDIAKIDAKAITAFSGVLTTAEQKAVEATAKAKEAADAAAKAEADRVAATAELEKVGLERRSLNEFYETKVVPGLSSWEEEQKKLRLEKAQADALAQFYKAQNDAARETGFIPKDAPTFTPPAAQDRNDKGQYVANAPGGTPGSPTFINPVEIASKIGDVAGTISDIQWKHQRLYGAPMPIAPSELIKQADSVKLSPSEYAARTFKFAEKEEEIRQAQARAHDEEIRQKTAAEKQAEYEAKEKALRDEFAAKEKARAEASGNNPELRAPAGASKFAEVKRAVETGQRPDPLKLSEAARRQATRQQIHEEIAQRETAGAAA